MRIGILIPGELECVDWAARLGFRSIEWIRFEQHPIAIAPDWKPQAEALATAAAERGIRISALGALYQNPLDPKQTDWARGLFHRAIEVAAHLEIPVVAGFAGAVIHAVTNERGGNPVYHATVDQIPALLAFWEPIAQIAADHGIRIAFEHCPQGSFHLPVMHYNFLGAPGLWEHFFDATSCENLGLEWDPSHLVCQFIDPVRNLRQFASKIFHVHAKDAFVDRALLAQYGICHPGVVEHRFPGLGESNWAEIVHELVRIGYGSDLNIEGRHDPVFRDHDGAAPEKALAGRQLEEAGLRVAKRTLERYVP